MCVPQKFDAIFELEVGVPRSFIYEGVASPSTLGVATEKKGIMVKNCPREGRELHIKTNTPVARDEESIQSYLDGVLSFSKIRLVESLTNQIHIK